MSLISKVAAIATAGAAAGETFWGSSVRITTSLTSGQAMDRLFNNAAEFGDGGNIVQAISSNALASSEGDGRAYILTRNPVDGSLVTERHVLENNREISFNTQQVLFYHPDFDACFARARSWWDPTGNQERGAGIQIDSDGTTVNKMLNGFANRAAPGNGSFFLHYNGNGFQTYPYNSTTHTSTTNGGREERTQPQSSGDDTGYAIWMNHGSSQVIAGVLRDDGSFKAGFWKYNSVSLTSIPTPSAVRTISGEFYVSNDYCDRAHTSDGNTVYGWRGTSGALRVFQVYGSSLSSYKRMLFDPKSSYNGQNINLFEDYPSMVYSGGYLYCSVGVRFRVSGESYDSVMYPIFKIDPSNFQVVDALGVKATGGAEYVYNQPPMLGTNAKETCLYHCFIHGKVDSRGADSHKLLKLPLDFSTLPAQTLSGNSSHDSIELWDFNSSTTGQSLPVFSELFDTMSYTSGSTSSEGYRQETQSNRNYTMEDAETSSTTSLTEQTYSITVS